MLSLPPNAFPGGTGSSREDYAGFPQSPVVGNVAGGTGTWPQLFHFRKLFKDDLNALSLNPSISVLWVPTFFDTFFVKLCWFSLQEIWALSPHSIISLAISL